MQNILVPLAAPGNAVTVYVEHDRFYVRASGEAVYGQDRDADAVCELWEDFYRWSSSLEQVSMGVPDWDAMDSAIGDDVLRFCQQEGVRRYLLLALRLVRQCFRSVRSLDVTLENDPDSGEEWASVDAEVGGDIEDILAAYNRYTDRWVSEVPLAAMDKVRLFYYPE